MKYSLIQKLKAHAIFSYDNINFARVMAAKLYPNGKIYTVKCFILAILYKPSIRYIQNNSDILISHNFDYFTRKDYAYIFNKLKKIVHNSNELIIEKIIVVKPIIMNIIAIYKLYQKNSELGLVFFDRIRVSSLEFYYKKVLNELKHINFNEKLYISFCDSYLEENLIAQYMNSKKLSTATLQHGQYRYIKKGLETTDVEGYLNFVSNYMFIWGEATKNEFLKANIDSSRLLKVGALKEFTDRKFNQKQSIERKFFIVILNGETHSQSNINMIKIANKISIKYGMHFYIRPHPMNKLNNYIKFVNDNYLGVLYSNDTIEKVSFSILHMTGVFVEMLSSRSIFFVYEDEYTEDIFKYDILKFKNLQEFNEKYIYMMENTNEYFKQIEFLYSYFNFATSDYDLYSNYKSAINSILNLKEKI